MAGGDGIDAMYMDNLDEFINDENKVVTYRWLSTTLQVHVNQAKQMLYNFVIQQRNKKNDDDLNVTYFLSGLQKNETSSKICRCEVVSEDKLDAIKSSFQKLYSCHVYSVQKSKLQDSNALYITDYNLMKENIFDSCKHSSIEFSAAKLAVESKPVIKEIKREEVKPSFLDNDAKAKPSVSESNGKTEKTAASTNGSNSKKSGIAGMFAKANVKKESPKTNEPTLTSSSKTETKDTTKKNSAASKKSPGVMSFFGNSTVKSKPSEEKPKEVKKEPIVEKPKEVKKEPIVEKPKEVKKEPTVASNKKRSETKKKPATSDSDDDVVHQKKKRRRIKDDLFDSSSSEEEMEPEDPLPPSPPPAKKETEEEKPVEKETKEEEMEEDEDEDPIPDTPEQKKPKIEKVQKEERPSVTVTSDGRRRKHIKRKKKKTYLNDEGFMVTETVMESDSTDASDIEPSKNKPAEPKKPSPAAVAAKAHADKGKQKQSSLMSFFTKK